MEHITELRDLSAQKENQGTVGIFKLRKPLMGNGEKVTEIPYDFESMTVGNKLMATKNMMSAGYPSSNVEEFDPDPFMEALNEYGLPWVVEENPVLVD